MALYVFSDAHLGCDSPPQEAEKVAKLGELCALVRKDGDRLVILGDLFDFWFEYKHAIPKEHTDVLLMLRDLVKRGIRIDYVSGNHDFWMDDYFERQIGLFLHRDKLDLKHAGLRFHMTHGDGLARADRGYRVLKRVLRNPVNVWLYRKLPPDWAIPLAKWVSGSSRDHTSKRDHTFAPDYEQYAESKLREGYDVVMIGHLHIPTHKKLGAGIYVNTGDFIRHFSYVRVDDAGVELKYMRAL
ncbi:MAG: UDP-2,3-diacylglucosamine diphosphatase [Candidatus Zixiibacteriota bacterium]